MKFLKINKKIIAAFATGAIIFSGIGYAANNYLAGDIRYTKSGAPSSMSVADALNELYDMKKNYILPSGTIPITTKGNQIDVKNYQYADTSGMYTGTEYQNYGSAQYQAGLNANANAVGYKTGVVTVSETGTHYINCGFKPKYIMATHTVGTIGTAGWPIFYYNQYISETDSFSVHQASNSFVTFTMEGSNAGAYDNTFHICDVNNTGFTIYMPVSGEHSFYWTAFK